MFEIKIEKRWCDAVYARTSVRTFTAAPTDEQLDRLGEAARKFSWQGIRIRLFRGPGLRAPIRGTNVYAVILRRKSAPEELMGFYGEAFVLEAVSMGLGTCWLGASYYKGVVQTAVKPGPDELVGIVIALGQCAEQTFAPKRRALEDLTGLQPDALAALQPWQRAALDSARVAPSAMNRQPWRFSASDGCVGILPRPSFLTRKYAPIDCGIAMLHLAVGAYSAGHEGVWRSVETGYTYR